MADLRTGPIENRAVDGVRPTQLVTAKLVNNSPVAISNVLIQGYTLNGTRILYVNELVVLQPEEVVTKEYSADFPGFEFIFSTGGQAEFQTQISFWGKKSTGELVDAHHMLSEDLFGSE